MMLLLYFYDILHTSVVSRQLLNEMLCCNVEKSYQFQMLHYNLSARKILLGEKCTCKISDIGKATDVRERTLQLKSTSVSMVVFIK